MESRTSTAASNLAARFEFLQERAQRRPIRNDAMDLSRVGAPTAKNNIGQLKEFYLQRLAKNDPGGAARMRDKMQGQSTNIHGQPQASGQQGARPRFQMAQASPSNGIEEIEILCNNCFTMIKASEVDAHTAFCYVDSTSTRRGGGGKPLSQIQTFDMKLQKLRAAMEARLKDPGSKVNVMRHLTQLRYHIDAALKWEAGSSEIGALSDHTVQQVKHLTATSRVLAPAVYILSKRVENVIIQKERELRTVMVQASVVNKTSSGFGGVAFPMDFDRDRDSLCGSVVDVNSVVSEMDSDTGTQYAGTVVTQDAGPLGSSDVGNLQEANEYLSLKNEDEQRRWFYSQCLTAKLACTDKTRARKLLISDLYAKVREENVPMDGWVQWIRQQISG